MARRKSRTLTEVELEFMKILWEDGESSTDGVMNALHEQGRFIADGSVRKILKILVAKGYAVRRPEGRKGFAVLPRRWVVERTFGWLGRYRRLARDYEHTVSSSEAMTYLASVRRMLKLATE